MAFWEGSSITRAPCGASPKDGGSPECYYSQPLRENTVGWATSDFDARSEQLDALQYSDKRYCTGGGTAGTGGGTAGTDALFLFRGEQGRDSFPTRSLPRLLGVFWMKLLGAPAPGPPAQCSAAQHRRRPGLYQSSLRLQLLVYNYSSPVQQVWGRETILGFRVWTVSSVWDVFPFWRCLSLLPLSLLCTCILGTI